MQLLFVSFIPLGYNGFTRNYFAHNSAMERHAISVSHFVRKSSSDLILGRLAEAQKIDYISPVQFAKTISSRKYDGILIFKKNGLYFYRSKDISWGIPRFYPYVPNLSQYRFNRDLSDLYRCALSLENTLVVGQVGEFTKANNQNFTLSVFRNLQKTHSNARLLFVGDGSLRMELKAQIDYEYLPVLMPGDTMSMHTMLSAMDVLLLPSGKADPYLIEEAQAAGLPCIVSSQENGIEATENTIKLDIDAQLWANTIGNLHIDSTARTKCSRDFLEGRNKADTVNPALIGAVLGA